jgi:hypothetical protein
VLRQQIRKRNKKPAENGKIMNRYKRTRTGTKILLIFTTNFVNRERTLASVPRNRFRQAGNRSLGSLKGLQIWALDCSWLVGPKRVPLVRDVENKAMVDRRGKVQNISIQLSVRVSQLMYARGGE